MCLLRRGNVRAMPDYSAPLDDMQFVMENLVDLPGITGLDRYSHVDAETVTGILEENARFMEQVFAPLNHVGDVAHSRWVDGEVHTPEGFKQAYQRYVEAGWGGVQFPPEYGGGGFPWLVGVAMQEIVTAANLSLSMCPLLTQGAIDLLLHHADEQQRETYLPKMVSGEWTGTMNLTEPQAGSDVGAVTTRAVPSDDGTWRISGQKIFISFGEHDMAENIIHLVLARVPDAPPGTRGISCFIVPKYLVNDDGSSGELNGVSCVSIEDKMGIKASPTCVMAYEDAVGYLIGEANQGMRYMFTMMNNARLAVGLQGLALGERAYQAARDYALERRQGRAPGAPAGEQSLIVDLPDVRRMLLTMRSTNEAMRAVCYLNAQALDLAMAHPDDEVRERNQELADFLTPISKGWCTDMGVEVTSLGIQIYGGMGYIEESGVAQYYRDARIAPIYEGTNGIQAMDFVGRKLPMRAGGVVGDVLGQIATTAEAAGSDKELTEIAERLAAAHATVKEVTDWLMVEGLDDPTNALAGASPYLRMWGFLAGGWLLARSAHAARLKLVEGATGDEKAQLEQKVVSARFFCGQLLPQVDGLAHAVTAGPRDLTAATF
jgi:3-(methylthio)propanoyl-CoA dehydrogenase